MDWNLKITDMIGDMPEHSTVIVNFIAAIRQQLKNSTCYVYSDNIQYHFKDNQGNNRIIIPDASINCRTKSRRGNTFTDVPRFDWRKKTVEVYELDYEGKLPKYYLQKTITEENKEELQLLHFPKIKITFDELFEEID